VQLAIMCNWRTVTVEAERVVAEVEQA